MNHVRGKNCVFLLPKLKAHTHYLQIQWLGIATVPFPIKQVKVQSLEHIIEKETDLRAACLLKDAINRSWAPLSAKSVAQWKKHLGLTVPVLRFMRRYPSLFVGLPPLFWSSWPSFHLSDTALLLDSQEQSIHQNHENGAVERLSKLLMMTKNRMVPLQSLHPLKWDLGLPDCFEKTPVPKYPDCFRVVMASNGVASLRLAQWCEELAVSALQKSNESKGYGNEKRQCSRGQVLVFPMTFPRGYGAQKKVREWKEEFEKIPYVSPYEEDSGQIDPRIVLMEKRVVGVLHEFLSLTVHKKTRRDYLSSLREELNLPKTFTRIFTCYPGIFYVSLKRKTTTVVLREGYKNGKLVDPHPLALHGEKFYREMTAGLPLPCYYKGTNAESDDEALLYQYGLYSMLEQQRKDDSDEAGFGFGSDSDDWFDL